MAAPLKIGATSLFLKKNWQIIYAVILIVLVPVTIISNTFFVINGFRKTVDVELQRTALIIGKMFNVTGKDLFADADKLQERLEAVSKVLPEVKSLDVLARDGDDFKVIASLYKQGIGQVAHGRQNALAWYDNQSIAYLTRSSRSAVFEEKLTTEEARGSQRYWGVVMPLSGADGKKELLLSAKISLELIDELVSTNLFWSYLWLAITVLIVILLLASNTRIFEYAILFRKLKEVDQMKDDFISMASHELRAPTTAIRGYLSLFLEDAFGKLDEKPKSILQTTYHITNHLATLIEDLLDVSRIEQGRMKLDSKPMQPETLVEEIVAQMRFEAEKKQLAFEYKKPAEPLRPIMVDESRIKQILINLVSNAIKYTPKGGVTITTIPKDDKTLEIKITDTGLGMSAEAREKLFQKFYRVKTTDTRDIPGTGLGLWITKQIVELMDGRIYVDSIEKVGTQVSVDLPFAAAAAPAAAPSDAKK
ncbi:HAMP domain-containing histidine kinase [Candidatus Uhrbacteria bacterium]|nr:HAMP domain-containing histidine kinase [Candidatus Uhrbacteria bacterium]